MNNRSSVNETNLVNFSTDLSTIGQLDTKDGAILSFPFDHIYACNSETVEGRPLQLEKEVEISTHCVINEEKSISREAEVNQLSEKLAAAETQNKSLKDLLIYHLDLIQQQNDLISKREKVFQALKQENESLRNKLSAGNPSTSQRHTTNLPLVQALPSTSATATVFSIDSNRQSQLKGKAHERKPTTSQRHVPNLPVMQVVTPSRSVTATVVSNEANPQSMLKSKLSAGKPSTSQRHLPNLPVVQALTPSPSVTSTIVSNESNRQSQVILNSFTELLLPSNTTNNYLFDSDLNNQQTFTPNTFEIPQTPNPGASTDFVSIIKSELTTPSSLESNLGCDNLTMIEGKRTFIKKEVKTESRPEPLYTVTPMSGNPAIQRIQRTQRRNSTGSGCLSRMPKTSNIKTEAGKSTDKMFEEDSSFDETFGLTKMSKAMNTYSKPKTTNTKKTTKFTGSLSDRLQLIDTTPTGEDPYQMGEADMRDQSPIPKLTFQKTNHGRMRMSCTDTTGATKSPRCIYDVPVAEGSSKSKLKSNRYNPSSTYIPSNKKESPKTLAANDPDLDKIDWKAYSTSKSGKETSVCDFSYGENANNLASNQLPSLDANEFQGLFSTDTPLNLDNLNPVEYSPSVPKTNANKSRKRVRTVSLMESAEVESVANKRGTPSKRGRKRALSIGPMKAPKLEPMPKPTQRPKSTRGRAAGRGKKAPLPGMTTRKPYHTLVGDPDISWYLGLDPELKSEDVDPTEDCKASTVEVPRWREKPYTSVYTMEGTEDVDDKVYAKRHQKLEAEEKRQLRWHMRRVREQRHIERLKKRHRSPSALPPAVYSVWPRPQRDVRFIEITDTLPVNAFGEPLPDIPKSDFMLPWIRTSKAQKRSKRSKTLH